MIYVIPLIIALVLITAMIKKLPHKTIGKKNRNKIPYYIYK